MKSKTRIALYVLAAFALAAGAMYFAVRGPHYGNGTPTAAAPVPAANYVGAQACASCHSKEFAAWRGSHHDLAMQPANAATMLGNFNDGKFSYAGVSSTFFRRDDKFFVNTDGPDGKLHDYEIKYTFGVAPLQQYLIELPKGRMQALSIAWDSRPQTAGGQRWFHLYPGQAIKAGDRLHWTGIDQNWNYQCAECHSTDLHKNFDQATDSFKTTWSDMNVACEACHGPGSNHVSWARHDKGWQDAADRGLSIALDERHGITWSRDTGGVTAMRSAPRTSSREVETCAVCHARRGPPTGEYVFGHPLADTHRPALLEDGLYWPDGQMRDEVYNYASFLQSKMFAHGVTCSDCHDPHTQKLRAVGNAVCTQCHLASNFDAVSHTHHPVGSPGAACAGCHMPTVTYMQVDPRHDHSIRIPRPDRTVTMGVPNACNQCHQDHDATWAALKVSSWYPHSDKGHQQFAEAFDAATRDAAGARGALIAIAGDNDESAIARASALERLARFPGPLTTDAFTKALDSSEPLVRGAAVDALGGEAPPVRAEYLPRMLEDPLRSVRMGAARALVGVPLDGAEPAQREAFNKGLDEYIAAQKLIGDRPEGHGNLGVLYAEQGRADEAQAELRQALAIDPTFVPASVNLADLYRMRGDEVSVEAVLREALKASPQDASLHHALGLALVRQKRMDAALAELKEAMRLAPDQARFAYLYGVGLFGAGKQAAGIETLAAAHKRFTGDAGILQALATMERDLGNKAAAIAYAHEWVDLMPDDPEAKQVLAGLEKVTASP